MSEALTVLRALPASVEVQARAGGYDVLLPLSILPSLGMTADEVARFRQLVAAGWSVETGDLPEASATNAGAFFWVNDENGGTQYRSDGVSMIKQSPGLTEYDIPAVAWADRGTGAVGQVKRITNMGNNPLVEAQWNGTRWTPRGGRQMIYDLAAPIENTGASPSVTLPNVTLPGGSWGLSGGYEFELVADCAVQTPSARVVNVTYDSTQFINDSAAQRHAGYRRLIKNKGATGLQVVMEKNGDYDTWLSGNQTVQQKTKDTTTDLVVAGTITMTVPVSDTLSLWHYRIYWVGQGV